MTIVLLWLAVGALLGPSGAAGSPIGITQAGDLILTGSTACYATGLVCEFRIASLDLSLIFFRWDLDGNGVWETPDQTGAGPLGKWSTTSMVSIGPGSPGYDPDALRACVQGWDGASAKVIGGVVQPDGPVLCSTPVVNGTLSLHPGHWSDNSEGNWVHARLRLPATADESKVVWSSVTLEGVPIEDIDARPGHASKEEGGDFAFRVDRGALTTALGPGTHTVYLTGIWDGGFLIAFDDVTING